MFHDSWPGMTGSKKPCAAAIMFVLVSIADSVTTSSDLGRFSGGGAILDVRRVLLFLLFEIVQGIKVKTLCETESSFKREEKR